MSERTTVVVEFPLTRKPTVQEARDIYWQGFAKAKELVGPGTVLGIVSSAMGESKATGQPVFLIKFAVDAPEAIQAASS